MPVGYAGVAPQENFRVGLGVITELGDDFREHSFGNTTFRTGFNYTVPAGRRAIIERLDVSVYLDGTIAAGGTVSVDINFIPAGGASHALQIFDLRVGDGPGQVDSFAQRWGQLLPGDQIQTFLSSLNCGTTGSYRSQIRGVEYDE